MYLSLILKWPKYRLTSINCFSILRPTFVTLMKAKVIGEIHIMSNEIDNFDKDHIQGFG